MHDAIKSLSDADQREAFLRAVHSFSGAAKRWQQRIATGLTDSDLAEALRFELGIAGGSGGRDTLQIHYEGSGLKIWASWQSLNPCSEAPIFEGRQTIAMARNIFTIPNHDDCQMSLF